MSILKPLLFSFIMPYTIDPAEWAEAESYFADKPVSNHKVRKLTRESSPHHEASTPKIKYSYLSFGSRIYQLYPGEKKPGGKIAGTGCSARVKYLHDEKSVRYTVKIDKDAFAGPRKKGFEREDDISLDIGFFKEVGYRVKPLNPSKNRMTYQSYRYAVMADHGEELHNFLKKGHLITPDERLNIAFQACFKVYQLHEGHLSKTGQPLAHLDIKSKNFFYNQETQTLTLGDYGFAEYSSLETPLASLKGTPNNLPFTTHWRGEMKYWSKRQLDIFAVMRTCHCPLKRMTFKGYFKDEKSCAPSILSDEVLDDYGLRYYFDTSQNEKPKHGPLFLSAICLLAKIKAFTPISQILGRREIQAAIVVLHFTGLLDSLHLNTVLTKPFYAKALSTFISRVHALSKDDISAINEVFNPIGEKAHPETIVKVPTANCATDPTPSEAVLSAGAAGAADAPPLGAQLPKDSPLMSKVKAHDEMDEIEKQPRKRSGQDFS